MKLLKVTYEHRAYTEDEAKDAILKFRTKAAEEGYTVGAAGYTYKCKKKKNIGIVAEAWVVKCVAIYDEIWDDGEGEGK
jgi:hypothetical protein